MIKYITSRPLWFNILIAIGGVFLLLVIFILLLGIITRHGKYKTVPYVIGKNINTVEKQLDDAGFETGFRFLRFTSAGNSYQAGAGSRRRGKSEPYCLCYH